MGPGYVRGHPGAVGDRAPPGDTVDTAATLVPFIVWLASRETDEQIRRRHRRVVEHYLAWCRTDAGPARERRQRYEVAVARDGAPAEQITQALARFDEYRSILAMTRIPD
ncbi:hypothetical protein ACFQ34_14440 [Pseudonocardia benzenivorans]|uniref:Uncharacterized protein n=1 Tax=Pseudonocardia benzenivorans TaxID=228005 RepID=A0ABW3VJG5_9PSEU